MLLSIFAKNARAPTTLGTRSGGTEAPAVGPRPDDLQIGNDEGLPPVVARMVVEIRSDGTRTVARGALEDLQTGERVSLQANATTPVALAKELTKMILKTPAVATMLARQAVRDMLPNSLRERLAGRKK